jgi:hypothetical protein
MLQNKPRRTSTKVAPAYYRFEFIQSDARDLAECRSAIVGLYVDFTKSSKFDHCKFVNLASKYNTCFGVQGVAPQMIFPQCHDS